MVSKQREETSATAQSLEVLGVFEAIFPNMYGSSKTEGNADLRLQATAKYKEPTTPVSSDCRQTFVPTGRILSLVCPQALRSLAAFRSVAVLVRAPFPFAGAMASAGHG